MIKREEKQQVEHFARFVLHKYFCENDVDFLIDNFSDDIVWIGAGEHQKAEGKEAVSRYFLEGKKDLAPCKMWGEVYETRKYGENIYLCEASSYVKTVETVKMVFEVHQRTTFLFSKTGERFKIEHIHNSTSFSQLREDELFPAHAAETAYKELQERLTQKERQIELLLARLPGGMAICYLDDTFTTKWVSEGLYHLLGYFSYEEYVKATGNCCKGFVYEDDFAMTIARVNESLSDEGRYGVEYRVKRQDGNLMWVADFGQKITDTDGEEVIYYFISDITDRKNQEFEIEKVNQQSKRRAEFLSGLYDTLPCGIIQIANEVDYEIINANRMAWEIYGYTEQEYLHDIKDPLRLVMQDDKKWVRKIFQELTLGGDAVSYSRKASRKDGSRCWLDVNTQRLINADGLEVIQALFTDVTETKKLQWEKEQEQSLENSSLRAAIFTAYPLIMSLNLTKDIYRCFSTEEDIIKWASQGSYTQLVQFTVEELQDIYIREFIDKFSCKSILKAFAAGEQEVYMEMQMRGKDEQLHWISVHIISVANPYNDDVLAIDLVKVLDHQRAEKMRQEQLLRDALASAKAANHAKSDFLSRMSHDIRTPMNAIIGMTNIGLLKFNDPICVKDCFEKIGASSQFLLSLINDILDMSKIESGKMTLSHKAFQLAGLIKEIQSIIVPQALEREQHFQIKQTDVAKGDYIGDELRLKQILMNLLSNALKFTQSKGKIMLSISEEKRVKNIIYLKFMVKDTGIGISDEFLGKLFQPFEQELPDTSRNKTGSGLGLSIVYNLVQLMGGTIEVQSSLGLGSTFTVTLPLELTDKVQIEEQQKEMAPFQGMKERGELVSLQGQKVLLVEDNELNLEIAKALLEMRGIIVETAINGQEAIDQFSQSSPYDYLAILMDIRMPVMDGLQATRLIRVMERPDSKEVPIIAMSANAFEEDKGLAKEAGLSDYLVKPVDIELLFHKLESL